MRATAVFLLSLILLGVRAPGLSAQEPEPLRFTIAPETGGAVVELLDLFADESLVQAVRSGLPLRIRVQIQLWKAGFFDNQKDDYDWRASVLFDPLTRRFLVQSSERTGAQVEVNTLDEARAALQTTLDVPLRPPEPGRYYYIAVVEMETLSLSDLEELQRWLQGELVPVVAGERDVEGALAKGFRRVLVRMLGLPAKRFQVKSRFFRIPSQPGGGGPVPSYLRPSTPNAGRLRPQHGPF